ncbi:MAG: transferase hexapeptide repeat family protein [Crocinitomicaceae bacterium]
MFVKKKMPVYSFKEFIPVVDPSSFIHSSAVIIGNVIIGKNVYIGPNAVLRGDWGLIQIDDGCNVQENCVIHMFPGTTVHLEENAHVGHGAIIHGATLGRNCLIGMNSVIMDDTKIGKNTIVGALSLVQANQEIPANSLAVGNPAKVVKELSEEQINWKTKGTEYYQKLPSDCKNHLKECEPLHTIEQNRPIQVSDYQTWKKHK